MLAALGNQFGDTGFTEYRDDPVRFGEEVLKESYTDEVKQVMESVRDNAVTIAQSSNAVGKSHCAARIAAWWYKTHHNSQVFMAAAPPESNLRRILWAQLMDIAEKHPQVFKSDTVSNLLISRNALSFISGLTIPTSGSEAAREAKFSGKHAESILFLVDEGDAVPDECYRGIESCMTGGKARLLVMFNPRAQAGAPYRMVRDGRAHVVRLSAFNHPNVITGKDVYPGAVTRATIVRRINQWCRPLMEGESEGPGTFPLPGYLEGVVGISQGGQEYPPLRPGIYKIVQPEFSYMCLGEYPSQASNQLISREWILKARERWDKYVSERGETPPVNVPAVMGLDVGEFGSDANVVCLRYGGYVAQLISWTGVDVQVTADKAAAIFKEKGVSSARIDAIGVGAGVQPAMARAGCSAVAIKASSKPTEGTELGEFVRLRDQLWWACREWLRTDPGSMLPPDERLLEELQVPTYQTDSGRVKIMKKEIMRELLKRSPDRADALCLTFARGGYFSDCNLWG